MLQRFLDQDVIYHTIELRERLEVSARDNLSRALAKLSED